MDIRTNASGIPGTPEYFRARAEAFAMIQDIEDKRDEYSSASCRRDLAAWDTAYEEFDGTYAEFERSLGSRMMAALDDLNRAEDLARANPVVVEILRAQNRVHLLGFSYPG